MQKFFKEATHTHMCPDPLLILTYLLTYLLNMQWSAANIQSWYSENVTHQVVLWGCQQSLTLCRCRSKHPSWLSYSCSSTASYRPLQPTASLTDPSLVILLPAYTHSSHIARYNTTRFYMFNQLTHHLRSGCISNTVPLGTVAADYFTGKMPVLSPN